MADPSAGRADASGASTDVHSLVHLDPTELPMALAALHRASTVGTVVEAELPGEFELVSRVIVGAGFVALRPPRQRAGLVVSMRRERTLADTVGPAMRVLICGLNPSLYAADAGVGFARGNNRFWRAALEAGIIDRDRDPVHALQTHGIGMTDLVKRATAQAAELQATEYAFGVERVRALCAWLRPAAICFVGLAGWRAVVDRQARPGWQAESFGGVRAYLMPSTSGLNASSHLDELTAHLRIVVEDQ